MLKQLALHGFKSFADKTAFDFSTGITGVVGPNGSGKSNVVDSIKWILGDQKASSLRGKSMSDVIFNGSSSRQGSAFAEATLTFCNESNFLPSEHPEVSVGRRLWKNGESEYLINGELARLKDVRNLFMGTGAGASSYCIIEQGRVSQILQTNASSRRLVFEEAAGISRYQARRAEALRKLDRVEQHVVRLTDIVDEAESRLSSVRNQAAKAAKYREIRTELQALWVGLAADEYRRTSRRQTVLASEVEELTTSLATITSDQEHLEAERTETEAALTRVEEHLRGRQKNRNDLQSRIASLRTTVRHEHSRLEELDLEFERLRAQRSLLKSRTQEATDELNRNQSVLDNEQQEVARLREQLADAENRYTSFEAEVAEAQTSLAADREQLMNQMQKNSGFDSQLATAQKNLDDAASEIAKLTADYETREDELTECDERFRQQESQVKSLEDELTAADDGVQALRSEREDLVAKHAELVQELAGMREERTTWEARLSVLEDLERRQEGLRMGTREILKRAQTEKMEPWTSIVGSVNDLLDVELDKAALLEVALCDRSQLIVIREMDAFIEYINTGRCQLDGRVGFVSLADIRNSQFLSSPWRPADAELPNLEGERGVVCAAADLATCSELTPRLAVHLLGDTWVVETLNDAILLSDKTQRKCRFVTLQGELVESDGTLFAGIELSASSVLTRRSELRRLASDIKLAEQDLVHKQAECDTAANDVAAIDEKLETALSKVQSRSEQLTELKSAFSQITHERSRLIEKRDEVESRKAALVEQNSLYSSQLTESQGLLAAGVELIESLKSALSGAETTLVSSRQQLEQLTSERTQAELALGKQQERSNALREGLDRLKTDVEQRSLQEEEAERREEVGSQRRQEITFRILNATSELSQLYLQSEAILNDVRQEALEEKRLKSDRSGVAARESQLASQHRELATRLHSLEMESGTLAHQLESTAARIEDEFQFSLEEAVKSGVSAMASHVIPSLAKHEEEPEPLPEEPATEESLEEGEEVPASDADAVDDAESEYEFDDELLDSDEEPDDDDEEYDEEEDFDDDADADEEEPESELLTDSEADDVESVHDQQSSTPENQQLSAVDQLDDEEFEELRSELEERVERLRRRMKNMGNVSTETLDDLEELEGRFGGLSHQLQDLIHARDTLEAIVRRINSESKRLFTETFESIRGHFQDLFRKLFGGGEGDVILEDPEDPLECGIDIVARPPGKELRSISLLSGGEKTMTAVALLLAIFRSRPSPFCILDEVDAALDEANVDRFVQVLREFQETTQFIMITHRKPSMSVCDLIFGVTMEESGISKRLTVRFEDVNDNGDFNIPEEERPAA
ncbi:MAG: chromosome segregation protein SMC [Planctomycetaceae bacterium]